MRNSLYLLFILLAALPAARAQDSASPPPEVTIAIAEERAAYFQSNSDLDEETRTRIADLYQQAAAALRQAQTFSTQREELDNLRITAPARLEALRAEQTALTTQPTTTAPTDVSLTQIEQLLAQAEAESRAARETATGLDSDAAQRTRRREELPAAITQARQRLTTLQSELSALPPDDPAPLTVARRFLAQARIQAGQAEIALFEAETASYEARGDLLQARRDRAAREVTRTDARVRALRDQVAERRRVDAEEAAAAADQAQREAARAHPALRKMAEENAEWARLRADPSLAERITRAVADKQSADELMDRLTAELDTLRNRLELVGQTKAMGLLMRRQLESLPTVRQYERAVAARGADFADLRLEELRLVDERNRLRDDEESIISEVLSNLAPETSERQRAQVERAARELIEARRGFINAMISDHDALISRLRDLDESQTNLIRVINEARDFISERILWTRSDSFPGLDTLRHAGVASRWLLDPDVWRRVPGAIVSGAQQNPPLLIPAALAWLALLLLRSRLSERLVLYGEQAARPYTSEFAPTVKAALITIMLAVRWPSLLAGIGWLLQSDASGTDLGRSLGLALLYTSVVSLGVALVRQTCQIQGLGEAHFGWSEDVTRQFRSELAWFSVLGLPLITVSSLIHVTGELSWQHSLGRAFFILTVLTWLVLTVRILRPGGALMSGLLKSTPRALLSRTRLIWRSLLVVYPAVLALLSLAGYHYTAVRLSLEFGATVLLAVIIFGVYEVLERWLLISRRQLALEQYRRKREAAASDQKSNEPPPDLTSLSKQTSNLLRWSAQFAFVVGLWFVWIDVLPALRIFDRFELWTTTVQTWEPGIDGAPGRAIERVVPVTLQDIGLALLVFFLTTLAALNLPGLLEITVLQRMTMQNGTRYAIATISRYTITAIGLVIAFNMIGMGWSKVQWLVAALGVGLGFGLQEIFANFVSGLIILFERPIRVGDTVTVGGHSGTVTNIHIRATTITDWDRKELIIPNREFITGQVINWTLTDTVQRITIPVGVAYGSDTELVEKTLLELAAQSEFVMKDPPPRALFLKFGDSTLDFELRVFIASPENLLNTRHSLMTRIDRRFRELGIEIAFPQRDLHIRSIDKSVRGLEPAPEYQRSDQA